MILSFVLFNKKKRERKNWLKWFALRGPELTQMIRAPRSRTDSNDSRSAVLNWLKWFALRGPDLTQREKSLTSLDWNTWIQFL